MPNDARTRLRFLTLLYGLAISLIIVAADRGVLTAGYLAAVPAGDKVGHFLLMGVLSYLLNASLEGQRFRWGRCTMLKGSLLVAALVVLEEVSQIWIPRRSFDLLDLAADFAGIWIFGRWSVGGRRPAREA